MTSANAREAPAVVEPSHTSAGGRVAFAVRSNVRVDSVRCIVCVDSAMDGGYRVGSFNVFKKERRSGDTEVNCIEVDVVENEAPPNY